MEYFWNGCKQLNRKLFKFPIWVIFPFFTRNYFLSFSLCFSRSAFDIGVRQTTSGIILFNSFKNSNFCIDCDSLGLDRGLSCVGSSGICVFNSICDGIASTKCHCENDIVFSSHTPLNVWRIYAKLHSGQFCVLSETFGPAPLLNGGSTNWFIANEIGINVLTVWPLSTYLFISIYSPWEIIIKPRWILNDLSLLFRLFLVPIHVFFAYTRSLRRFGAQMRATLTHFHQMENNRQPIYLSSPPHITNAIPLSSYSW